MGKVKVKEKEFILEGIEEALILAIQELTKQIKVSTIRLSNG